MPALRTCKVYNIEQTFARFAEFVISIEFDLENVVAPRGVWVGAIALKDPP